VSFSSKGVFDLLITMVPSDLPQTSRSAATTIQSSKFRISPFSVLSLIGVGLSLFVVSEVLSVVGRLKVYPDVPFDHYDHPKFIFAHFEFFVLSPIVVGLCL
jgi:hypothetical protein